MAWQAVEAEIAREMREYAHHESLEDLLYQAWLFWRVERRERDCTVDWRQLKWRKARQAERDAALPWLTCEACSAQFRASKWNQQGATQKRFCGAKCAEKSRNRRRDRVVTVPSRPCVQCGTTFTPARSDKMLCSKACGWKRDRLLRKATP
jgi:hypothetical protein